MGLEFFLLNLLPLIAGVVLSFSYIPQLRETLKTKNVDGVNKRFWQILCLALFMLVLSTGAIWFYLGTFGNFIVELFNFGLAFWMLILVNKYEKKKVD